MGIALGIDFSWIFFDLGRQVGTKLASKIDKKSIHQSIKNMIQKKDILTRLGGVLGPSWRVGGERPKGAPWRGGIPGTP